MIEFSFDNDELQRIKVRKTGCSLVRQFSDVKAYASIWYRGWRQPDNPDYLNTFKNPNNERTSNELSWATNELKKQLIKDLPNILNGLSNVVVCTVPRSKRDEVYTPQQLLFRSTIQSWVQSAKPISKIIVEDGTLYIRRIKDTQTTHLMHHINYNGCINNTGPAPYWGIASDTCLFNRERLRDKTLLLIDDIYTEKVNIDEDFILTLQSFGVKQIIFYAVAYTFNRRDNSIQEI